MRALIVGAGAVGRYLAARIALAGHEVVLLARPDTAPHFNERGITLRVGATSRTVPIMAIASAQDYGGPAFELVVVAVKSYATLAVARLLAGMAASARSSVLSVQNGLGNEETLAAALGADRIVAGALTVAARSLAETETIASKSGGLCLAPIGGAPHNWIIAALADSGLRLRAVGDWRSLKWSKLCINLLANGVCAALDWTPSQVYADGTAFAIDRRCFLEAAAVMKRSGIAATALIDFPVPALMRLMESAPAGLLRRVLRARVGRARGGKLPSLLLDVRAGRRHLEIDSLNGAVAARAVDQGRRAPANAAVARVVQDIAGRSVSWSKYRGRPQALLAAVEEAAGRGGAASS
ncbi:MAG: 2-dehydropantoate 2-reductase [Candidatus Eremiobacteraeota bacterium]|nr:2-dehydropantoate 2-reductase [Candidatus Eremiobacteraeota bacterium]